MSHSTWYQYIGQPVDEQFCHGFSYIVRYSTGNVLVCRYCAIGEIRNRFLKKSISNLPNSAIAAYKNVTGTVSYNVRETVTKLFVYWLTDVLVPGTVGHPETHLCLVMWRLNLYAVREPYLIRGSYSTVRTRVESRSREVLVLEYCSNQ